MRMLGEAISKITAVFIGGYRRRILPSLANPVFLRFFPVLPN